MSNGQKTIPSVDSTITVLEFLTKEENNNSTLSEISKSLEINKTTCLRILKTLQNKDFVSYNVESKRYKLGPYLIGLGNRASDVNDYISVAISYLPEICKSLNHTVVLAKRINGEHMTYIAKEETDEQIRLTVSTGENFPLIGGAAGKIYLSFLDDKEITQVINYFIEDNSLPRYTERSITDPNLFLESVIEAKKQGICETDSEHTLGIYAVACPIFNSKNEIVLSISVFIPSFGSNLQNLPFIRKKIQDYAQRISNDISNYFWLIYNNKNCRHVVDIMLTVLYF